MGYVGAFSFWVCGSKGCSRAGIVVYIYTYLHLDLEGLVLLLADVVGEEEGGDDEGDEGGDGQVLLWCDVGCGVVVIHQMGELCCVCVVVWCRGESSEGEVVLCGVWWCFG